MSKYGMGAVQESTAATAGSGTSSSNLAAATAGIYYFAVPQGVVIVFNHPATGSSLLYGRWNDGHESPTDATPAVADTGSGWDFVIEPGNYAISPYGEAIKSVGLYSASAATYGTDFLVQGHGDA